MILCLLRIMFASEEFQQFIIPRLHAETDSIDAESLQHVRFSGGNASGIRFDRPFDHLPTRSSRSRNPRSRNSSCEMDSAVGVPPPK